MKNILYSILLIVFLSFIIAFKSPQQSVALSGTWILNVAKSDFGDSPAYVLQKQLDITDNASAVKIKYTASTEDGADSVFTLSYSLGKVLDNVTAERRTQHFHITRVKDGHLLEIEHSSSFPEKPDSEEYHTVQRFQLSADGNELTLDKQVKVYNGYTYTAKGVYERRR
jgi:hypothetical protein